MWKFKYALSSETFSRSNGGNLYLAIDIQSIIINQYTLLHAQFQIFHFNFTFYKFTSLKIISFFLQINENTTPHH